MKNAAEELEVKLVQTPHGEKLVSKKTFMNDN
jgi:hypothetical protein